MTLYVALGVVLAIAAWVFVRMRRGHLVGSALVSFEQSYDDAYRELGSKRNALRQALKAFAAAPKIRELRGDEIEVIVEIVGAANDPKRVIRETVLRLNAVRALQALRNQDLLRALAVATNKRDHARIKEPDLRLAEDAFEAGHKFVELQAELNAEAGTFASLARNLSRPVDYDQFERRAGDLKAQIAALATRVSAQASGGPSAQADFEKLLSEHLEALSVAATIFADKTAFLARKARSAAAPDTKWSDFTQITQDEDTSLARCQDTGDRLTRFYRQVAG